MVGAFLIWSGSWFQICDGGPEAVRIQGVLTRENDQERVFDFRYQYININILLQLQ